jgi:cytochrome c oxidase assembly protein subunit 15
LSAETWASEFAKYKATPEYRQINAGMSLEQFKTIYWWEWGHRFLGRLLGLAYAVPFAVLLATRRIPRRLGRSAGSCWRWAGCKASSAGGW